jgi:hypothetical protein
MYPLLVDGPGDTFSEVARMANRGESPYYEISKVTETGNDGETFPPNRSHQVCYHGVSHRFTKGERQVVAEHWWGEAPDLPQRPSKAPVLSGLIVGEAEKLPSRGAACGQVHDELRYAK